MFEDLLIEFLVIVLMLAVFILYRTLTFPRKVKAVATVKPVPVDAQKVAEHLGKAVRCKTISDIDLTKVDIQAFKELHRHLEKTYPLLHDVLKREVIGERSLLYTWAGSQVDLKPVLFAAHMDVVPVDAASISEWHYPPFEGQVADGFVWGRGTLDNKNQVIAILESIEGLIREGYKPKRTLYLAFGGDEEVSGLRGAKEIVSLLKGQGIKLAAVLDEGGSILESALPGVKDPLALVGVAEKGFITLELKVEGKPGHSAQPPPQTAIGILARALAILEAYPLPEHIGIISSQFQHAGEVVPFWYRMIFANLWLFGGNARRIITASPRFNAAVRTTTAVTMISGGVKDNILPSVAKATVNFRLIPGDTVASVCEHVRRVIGDERVTFEPSGQGAWEPSPVSSTASIEYQSLSQTIACFFTGTPVVPYLVLGATDSRHYSELCDQIYRFSPVQNGPDDMKRVHGTDERIEVEALGKMVQFYHHLIPTWTEEID